ncbi:MAG: hypothetical protein HQM10_04945 [Candidatus Riflebacteria bacterium]|nr:hypothetical protein [Candidatus Riflebacteria bacterium]
MHQLFLPGFPEGSIKIPETRVSFLIKENTITYFIGNDNYFSHSVSDENSRRYIFASLILNGHVRPCNLEASPLNIPHRTIMNWIKQIRETGPSSFFLPPANKKPRIFSTEVIKDVQELFFKGLNVAQVARKLEIQESTLRKAVERGLFSPKISEKKRHFLNTNKSF